MKTNVYIKNITLYGLLIALAMIFSFVETLIPITVFVPGMKLGLANLVVIVALYTLNDKSAVVISLVRILLVAFTFGNLSNMLFSIAGGILSLTFMIVLKRSKRFSRVFVSIVGAISHNIGQIIMAIFVVKTISVVSYLPILIIVGVFTGMIIGSLANLIIQRIKLNN